MEGTCGWKELGGDRNLVQEREAGLGCKEELNPRQSPFANQLRKTCRQQRPRVPRVRRIFLLMGICLMHPTTIDCGWGFVSMA